jgi:hypothetical protein
LTVVARRALVVRRRAVVVAAVFSGTDLPPPMIRDATVIPQAACIYTSLRERIRENSCNSLS